MAPSRTHTHPMPLLGAHFSIAGGLVRALDEAAAYGCPVVQLFTKNAATWKEREVSEVEARDFRRRREELEIRYVAAHTAYLINLAAADNGKRRQGREALKREMARSSMLGIDGVVLHPGSHMGDGPAKGIRRIQEGIDRVLATLPEAPCSLLLETTAGQGTSIGHTFEELAEIRAGIESPERVGFCLDTAHVFAAGYDLRDDAALERTLAAFDRILGLNSLQLIHLNDSLKPLGSRVDRHAAIGRGEIGIAAFRRIMGEARLEAIPKIIETPKKDSAGRDMDRLNLDLLRSFWSARHGASPRDETESRHADPASAS